MLLPRCDVMCTSNWTDNKKCNIFVLYNKISNGLSKLFWDLENDKNKLVNVMYVSVSVQGLSSNTCRSWATTNENARRIQVISYKPKNIILVFLILLYSVPFLETTSSFQVIWPLPLSASPHSFVRSTFKNSLPCWFKGNAVRMGR